MSICCDGIEGSDNAYLLQHGITDMIKELIHDLQRSKPTNHIAYMSQWLNNFDRSLTHQNESLGIHEAVNTTSIRDPNKFDSEDESVEGFDFALFTPVKELTLDAQTSLSQSFKSLPTAYTGNKAKRQNNESRDLKSSETVIRSPQTIPTTVASSFPEIHPSMKQLVDAAQHLSPSEHAAALVFVEGLLDKSFRERSESMQSFGVDARSRESHGFTTSDKEVRSPKDFHGTENVPVLPDAMSLSYCDFCTENTFYLQDLVRDALAMSAMRQGPSELEEYPLPLKNVSSSVLSCQSGSGYENGQVHSQSSQLSVQIPSLNTPSAHGKPLNKSVSSRDTEETHMAQAEPIQSDSFDDEMHHLRCAMRHYEPFDGMSDTHKETFIRSMERSCLNERKSIRVENGQIPWWLTFVHSGSIAVEENGKVLRVFTAGHFFGRREFLLDTQLNDVSTIRAITGNVVLYTMMHESFKFVMENENSARDQLFLDYLLKCELFSILSTSDRGNFLKDMRVHCVEEGSIIQQRGHSVEWLSLIIDGTVRLTGTIIDETTPQTTNTETESMDKPDGKPYSINESGEAVLEITKGHLLGDFEMVFGIPALMDAVAVTPVVIGRIHAVFFRTHFASRILEKMKNVMGKSPDYTILRRIAPTSVHKELLRIGKLQILLSSRRTSNATQASDQSGQYSPRGTRASSVPSARQDLPASNAGVKSLNNPEKWRNVRTSGELIFCGKQNLYRFPGMAFAAVNTIIMAVVAEGTLIRWNAACARVTGFQPHNILGQRIFSLLSTEKSRRVMQEQLAHARKYAGNWDGYVAAGFSTPQAYRFRQSSALYDVNLFLTVVPSSLVSSSDVMLLVGREEENHAAASYAEDAVRWLDEVLRPQLRAFQRRVEGLEAANWVISLDDGKRLRGHLEACNRLLERYLRLAVLNLETMDESWKPVRLHNVMRCFLKEVALAISRAGNTISTFIDDGVPLSEVFFDVEKALEVLRRVVTGINRSSTNVHISLELSIVCSGDPVICRGNPSRSGNGTFPFGLSPKTSPQSITTPNAPMSVSQTHSTISGNQTNSNIVFMKDSMCLYSTSHHRQFIDGYSSLRRIRFLVADDANIVGGGSDLVDASGVSSELGMCRSGSRSSSTLQRVLRDCESLITGMGGSVSLNLSSAQPISLNTVCIELPLLHVPWANADAEVAKDYGDVPSGRTLTVVVAERSARRRNGLCRLMWARRHAVVPVTSYREVMAKIEAGDLDILVIDPLFLDITDEETVALRNEAPPFDAIRNRPAHLVVVLHTDDFSDWRSRMLAEQCHIIELPKPASEALLHVAMHEAERVVTQAREDEEQIAVLRTAFSRFQRDRHKVGHLLGKGAFGDVYEVEDCLTGGKLAMKRMHIKDGVLVDDVVQELLAMTSLRHENIIHYFYCEKESASLLRLYMELASGGTLQYRIRCAGGPLPREDIVRTLQDLCRGLAYVHSKNYVHRDIKTANALIDHYGRTKIGDFGTAKRLKKASDELYSIAGSPQYMAPEVVNADHSQNRGYNQKADIWSLGCVAMELATGKPPFSFVDSAQGMGIYCYLSNLTECPEIPTLKNGDPLIYDFVRICLTVDPSKRPTACDLLHHELLQITESSERNEQLYRRAELLHTLDFYGAINPSDDGMGNGDEEYENEEVEDIFGSEMSTKSVSTCVGVNHTLVQETEKKKEEGEREKERKENMENEEKRLTRMATERDFFSSSSSSSS